VLGLKVHINDSNTVLVAALRDHLKALSEGARSELLRGRRGATGKGG